MGFHIWTQIYSTIPGIFVEILLQTTMKQRDAGFVKHAALGIPAPFPTLFPFLFLWNESKVGGRILFSW